jgi:4-alpha-glucanotransferase
VTQRPALRSLAQRAGILDGYHSALDGSWVETADATREALLVAMAFEASSEAGAQRALAELDAESTAARVEPLRVVVAGRPEARRLVVRSPSGTGVGERLTLRIEAEEGAGFEGQATVGAAGELELPELEPGRYAIAVRPASNGGVSELRQLRYVVPPRCTDVEDRLGARGGFGVWANLYSLRSDENWGFGNLGDLSALVRRAGREGAAFVGLNPLHALAPDGVCPYLPVSRLFRHPLYLDPERIPELAHCPEASRRIESAAFRERLAGLRASRQLDAGAVGAALDELLLDLYRGFAAGVCGEERARAFARYREQEGSALEAFATFAALADHFASRGEGRDWRTWPQAFLSPASDAVRRFREAHAAVVERHAWIQFELDRQLGAVAREAREAGLGLGLYTDLALGSDPGGSDAWSFPELFVPGVRVGAPPDAFSRGGQEWGFAPANPAALRRDGHRFWVRLLRAGFRHAGALRLDHAMSLERLFWIPEGRPPAEGAYVRYPHDELLGIVAHESRRHDAAVIAEDLGTLPEGFPDQLAERGILSSRVLLFERDSGGFRPADSYPRRCLVTANTHDLPPLAALSGELDLELRRHAGHLADDEALERARAERQEDRRALTGRLRADGWLDTDAPSEAELAAAVTAFLCATPAVLVGLALDDLAGEREPVNLPGVAFERHPSWTRRLHPSLGELWRGATARACLAAIPADRRADAPAVPAQPNS